MAIVFNECDKVFTITTENTKYMFKVVADKYLVHCFYGAKHQKVDLSYNVQSLNFASPLEDSGIPRFTLNSTPAEFAYYGTGDYRCTSLRVRGKDGDSCTWYEYKGYEIIKGRVDIKGLPNARQLETTETLRLDLFDKVTGCNLSLYYSVYPSHDIITRYFTLENIGEASAKIEKAMSICLDLPGHDYEIISLHGCQTTECNVQRNPIYYGNYSIASRRGASSHEHNPFMALVEKRTNEETGNTYAFNLVYSGSFLDEVEVNSLGDTRVGIGVGEENFSYTVGVGETFYSPEGIMMFTPNGLGDMSRKMHSFIRDAILPKAVFEQRPIVLNTWESFYFDFDAKKVTELASAGNECGMDMLVLDDGWFGARTSEEQGLGDWYPNPERFPNGLKSFVDEIKSKNMKFGIWIEPEMVNPNSELYRKHPDWCLVCKGREGSLARNQLVLDLCNPDVMDYLKNSFEKTFEGIDIDYFKWDFNRNPSEAGSPYLPADMQEEVLYRYQLKVYELMQWFRDKYPNAEIESCSGGGGRYDLGMMAMSTMIWASDNTFAHDRLRIWALLNLNIDLLLISSV